MTKRAEGEEPVEAVAAKPLLDPNAMSAADQLRVQEAQTARDAAAARGDEQAARDLDEHLRDLLTDRT